MAIAEMSKLRLIGLTADRDGILNALAGSGLAEIKDCPMPENTYVFSQANAKAEINGKYERVENAISVLTRAVENYVKETGEKCGYLSEGFEVGYGEFLNTGRREAELLSLCGEIEKLNSEVTECNNNTVKLTARQKSIKPFLCVKEGLSQFNSTRLTEIYFGTLPSENVEALKNYVENTAAAELQTWESKDSLTVVLVAAHRTVADGVLENISAFGFQRCPFAEDNTAAELYGDCQKQLDELSARVKELKKALFKTGENLKDLKTLADYYGFQIEKLTNAEKFPGTKAAFVMEAYVPAEFKDDVSSAIDGVTENAYYEFAEIDDGETPPTLMKNNKVMKNFEFVTNMYTPPNYREFDPNAVMSVFFSIFLGFIMADIGYGLLMMLGGFIFAAKQKGDTGMRRLATVIGIGGIFTVIFGVLFGSFFGFSSVASVTNTFTLPFLPPPIIPDAQNAMVSLAGINIPAVLLIALSMGIVHLMAGNACKAYEEFRNGRVADGIFLGLTWVVFLVGLLMLIFGLTVEMNASYLTVPGAVIAVAALLIAACTAGMHESGFGKVTKGFGAIYGIVNYLSDILSYARLYGLMLSGAIIAQIASGQGMLLVVSGNVALSALGVLVMIIGHLFNLAIGLLGAYIHDARLQYIEFFGKFYHGEGELFSPLGAKRKYLKLTN